MSVVVTTIYNKKQYLIQHKKNTVSFNVTFLVQIKKKHTFLTYETNH